MAKQNSEFAATTTVGAAAIVAMVLLSFFANGFSFSLGTLSGQATAATSGKTPYDAGAEEGYTQCMKDAGKYTEQQAIKKIDDTQMQKALTLLSAAVVANQCGNHDCQQGSGENIDTCPQDCDPDYQAAAQTTCTDSDKDVQGGTTVPVKGYVTANGQSYYDLCKDKYTISEYYCTTDGKAQTYPLTCPTGTQCKDATCAAVDTTGGSQGTGQQTGNAAGTNTGTTGANTGTNNAGTTNSGTAAGTNTGANANTGTYTAGQTSGQNTKTNQNTLTKEEIKKQQEEYKKGYEVGYQKCLDEKKVAQTNAATTGTNTGASKKADDKIDTDGDGLSDLTEKQYGTKINEVDTDHDGISDYDEVKAGTDPLTAEKIAAALCSDSDGGKEYGTKGVVTSAGYSTDGTNTRTNVYSDYTDTCTSTSALQEYFCNGDTIASVYPTCPTGTSCSDGACITTTSGSGTVNAAGTTYTCTDTDGDYGGKTFTTATYGEVTGNWYTDKIVKTYKDNCESSDYVYEAYCRADNTAYYTTIKCPTGTSCSNGVCA